MDDLLEKVMKETGAPSWQFERMGFHK